MMTPSRNVIGNRAIASRRRFPDSRWAIALLLAMSLLEAACDRAAPPTASAPPAESAATPRPDSAAPRPVAPATPNASKASAAVGSDPRLQPWMDEYAHTEAEEDRGGPIYRIAEQAALGVPAEQVVAALLDVFAREKSATLKSEIIGHLTKIRDPSALDGIGRGLAKDEPLEVRLTTVRTFEFLGDRRALPALRRAQSDPDPQVRDAARGALQTLSEDP